MTALEVVRAAPGLDDYLAEVEAGLGRVVEHYPGLVAEVGATLSRRVASVCGRRSAFLSSSPHDPAPLAAGVAVELVHMATLVHDDLIDGAAVRRGHAAAWSEHGEEAAKAAGDYLFARAFSVLAATGNPRAVAVLADASLALARGEAMQRRQRHDPDTAIEDYLERCALKTGKLFAAACLLGRRDVASTGSLGIAFQIADDILDCPVRRSRQERSRAPTSARARRRCRSCWRRARTSSARRSLADRSRARSSVSRQAVRSTGLASWRSTTLRRPGLASTARRVGRSSKR